MGPQHIREEVLSWVRKKTAHSTAIELFIPVVPELRTIIDSTPGGHLTFLTTALAGHSPRPTLRNARRHFPNPRDGTTNQIVL
jgi:hypothetical protein